MIVNGVLPAIDDAGPRARLASASADEDDDAPDAHAEDVASGSGVDAHVPAEVGSLPCLPLCACVLFCLVCLVGTGVRASV